MPLPDDIELKGEKGFEGEAPPGESSGFGGGGEMGFMKICGTVGFSHLIRNDQGGRLHSREEAMNDFPKPPLADAGNIFINRNNPREMNTARLRLILPDNLDLGVIDDEAARAFLHFAICDNLLTCGDDFGHKGHVKPTAGDFPRAEDTTGAIHDHRLIKAGLSEALRPAIDYPTDQADRFRRRLAGKAVEVAAIFVTLGKMN